MSLVLKATKKLELLKHGKYNWYKRRRYYLVLLITTLFNYTVTNFGWCTNNHLKETK